MSDLRARGLWVQDSLSGGVDDEGLDERGTEGDEDSESDNDAESNSLMGIAIALLRGVCCYGRRFIRAAHGE